MEMTKLGASGLEIPRLGVGGCPFGGSLGQGVLTGKYNSAAVFGTDDRRSRKSYVNFQEETFQKNLRIVEALRPIAADHGVRLDAAAVRFILDRLPGSAALCGVKRPDQLLTDALDWHLSQEELAVLDRVSRPDKEPCAKPAPLP